MTTPSSNTNDRQSKPPKENVKQNAKNEVVNEQQRPKYTNEESQISKKRRDRNDDDLIVADEDDEINKMKKIKKAMRETFSSTFDPSKLGLDFGTARVFGLSLMESFGDQMILKQVKESEAKDGDQKIMRVEDFIQKNAKDKIESLICEESDEIIKTIAMFILSNGSKIISPEQCNIAHSNTLTLIPSSINILITSAISVPFNVFEFTQPSNEGDLRRINSYFQLFKYAFNLLRTHPLCLMNDRDETSQYLRQKRLSLKNSIVSRIETEFESKIKSIQKEVQVLAQEQSQADLECEFQKAIVWQSQNEITILQEKILKINMSMDDLHSSMEQCKEDGGFFSEETKMEMGKIKKSNEELIERLSRPLNEGLTKKLQIQSEIKEKYEVQLKLTQMVTDNITRCETELKEFSSHKNKDLLLNQAKTSALTEFDAYAKRLEPFLSLAEGDNVRERKMDKILKAIISVDEVLLDGQMAMYKSLQDVFSGNITNQI